MIRKLSPSAVTALVLLLTASQTSAQCLAPKGLTGVWKANDGGTYYVRRLGTTVWWMGESADEGRSWTNVFKGVLSGDTFTGEWADVVQASGRGTLTLKIEGAIGVGVHGWRKIGGSGDGFGGEHWFQPCNDTN
jgi:hypothetical protein